jgi:MinD superfamily P-loop ATPase
VAVDLDVEEPNLHLFLNPQITHREDAFLEIPAADESKCTHCMACADLCQFKAITVMADVLLIFPEMCHGCGGCIAVCPEGVLTPDRRKLGDVSRGKIGDTDFIMGRLRVGEAMSPPLMRVVKDHLAGICANRDVDVIIDAPPGVSCPAVSAVMDTDLIVLVTEPTPFGNYDLQLAVKAFSTLNIPMAVVVNRDGLGDRSVYEFCRRQNLPILARIPFDSSIARSYSNGRIIAAESPALADLFMDLAARIGEMGAVGGEVAHA